MSFASDFKKTTGQIKSSAQSMVTGGFSFYCAGLDIFHREQIMNDETNELEDKMVFPSDQDLQDWLKNLFQKDLAYKALPAKALENMKKKGLTPKKQPSQIMNILVTASETSNVVLVHLPDDLEVDLDTFIKEALEGLTFTTSDYQLNGSTDKILTFNYDGTEKSSFKEKDILVRRFFDQLKKIGLCQEAEESDDES